MTSILSSRTDGLGFHYGFMPNDHRQINVRKEWRGWKAYVGGDEVPGYFTLRQCAEDAAVQWARENP